MEDNYKTKSEEKNQSQSEGEINQDIKIDNEQKGKEKEINKIEIDNSDKNNVKKEEEKKVLVITKYSSLNPELFSLKYISEYKCQLCGLIPSPETANEIICCGILYCDECIKKIMVDKKECPICKSKDIKYRKIKDDNKVFYKTFKNLKIKCPYKCEWEGVWSDLDIHLNECKFSVRYCKYKLIGCEFVDDNKKVIEHELNNDKLHLELAIKFIKINNIEKKKINFVLGEKCMTSCHPHMMTYMTSLDWYCDGRKLEHGCYSIDYNFRADQPRFRCSQCDFDLCDKCIVNYVI